MIVYIHIYMVLMIISRMSLPSMIPFNDNGDEVTGEVVKGAGNLTMGGRAPWAEGQRT